MEQAPQRAAGGSRWRRIESCVEIALSAIVFVAMVITVVDVFGRYLFSAPLKAAFELNQIGMALIIYLGLPLVTAKNEHIIAGVLQGRLKGAAERVRQVFINLFCCAVAAVLAWRLSILAGDLVAKGNFSWFLRIPQGPIAYFTSATVAVSALVFLAKAVRHALFDIREPDVAEIAVRSAG